MAIEITNNYSSVYESTYAAQRRQVSSKEEIRKTTTTQENSAVSTNDSDYLSQLAKLAPSVEFKAGNTYSSAKSGKTLTINPKLLEEMQNNPGKEKEMKELIKGVESMTKLMDGIHKASGWTVVYRHSYIDENGKYRAIAYVRNDFMLNMSDKLREERRKNTESLIEKAKEKTAKKKEELQENLEEKQIEKQDENSTYSKIEQLLDEKVTASKDGIIYLNDADMKVIISAAKEDNISKSNVKSQLQVGVNFDSKI